MSMINPELVYREMIATRNISDEQTAKVAIGQAMNRALIDMHTQSLTDDIELTMDATTGEYGTLDLATTFGLVFRQLSEWHLERSPFWTRDKTTTDADRRRAISEGRRIKGYTWTGPNKTYE